MTSPTRKIPSPLYNPRTPWTCTVVFRWWNIPPFVF